MLTAANICGKSVVCLGCEGRGSLYSKLKRFKIVFCKSMLRFESFDCTLCTSPGQRIDPTGFVHKGLTRWGDSEAQPGPPTEDQNAVELVM